MKRKILSVVLVCCLFFLLCGCGSVGGVMKSVKEGNADKANQLYLEKVADDIEKKYDLEESLQTYIEDLYDDLNDGKVSLAEARAAADTIHSLEMEYGSYTWKILTKLDALVQSKTDYENAMSAIAEENYLTAYVLLGNVISEDSNYSTAASKRNEIVNDGMRSLNKEIDNAVAEKNFQKAIDLVNEAISLWGNNEFLAGMLDYLPEQWQISNIEEAEQLRQAGKYSEAKEKAVECCLAFGLEEYPEEVSAELQRIDGEWWDAVVKEAETAFGSNKDYEAAIRVLQGSGLYGDNVDALIAQYQAYAPILLKEFTPTRESDYMRVGAPNQEDHTDVNGNVYDKAAVIRPRSRTIADIAQSESDSYIVYYLFGEYCSFDAILYRTYASLSIPDEQWPQWTTAKIYGDDVLLYEGPQITSKTYEQYNIHIDVTGVRELKIVLVGVATDGGIYSSYSPLLAIADATIQK